MFAACTNAQVGLCAIMCVSGMLELVHRRILHIAMHCKSMSFFTLCSFPYILILNQTISFGSYFRGRTDLEGCCWWGRGVLLTRNVCKIGKCIILLFTRVCTILITFNSSMVIRQYW